MQTLPYNWYYDADIFELEQRNLFRATWHYVGCTPGPPGTYYPAQVAGLPIMVVTDAGGDVRAFYNVCRHRGSIICEAPTTRDVIQCPYHAWTYELNGSLKNAPRSDREADFEKSNLGLVELAVGTWGRFLFVNPDPKANDLDSYLGRLPELIEKAGIDIDTLRFHERFESEYAVNWKVCAENFLECYHCPTAHPGFARLIDVNPTEYMLEIDPWFSTQYGAVRERWAAGFDPRGEVERGQFHLLWPSTTISIMPGRPNIAIGPIIPVGPERTRRYLDYLFAPDADQDWIKEMLASDAQVGREDAQLVARVQQGVRTGVIAEGVVMPRSEQLIAHFDGLLRQALYPTA